MSWTAPADLRLQVQRLWERGLLPASLVSGEDLFPRRLTLKGPTSRELAECFAEVRDWIDRLASQARHYRLVWRTVRHRILGENVVPAEVWIDSRDDALAFIGRQREAARFGEQVALTRQQHPELLPWLEKRPLKALELAGEWPLLLDIVAWLQAHPRPGIYLRQVEIPGVHSKFIEAHRAVLSELLDRTLTPAAIDTAATGVGGFCRRYGFRDKPFRQRLRILDPDLALLPTGTEQDLTVTLETFARLELSVQRVFITENEINFLAFPPAPRSLVLFGAGYGFEQLATAAWLQDKALYYWGDLDTHGFAILDQLRRSFPQAASFLMDRETLLTHRPHWGREPHPETRDLPRLTAAEGALFDELRYDRLGRRVRLEQEKIAFQRVVEALEDLS